MNDLEKLPENPISIEELETLSAELRQFRDNILAFVARARGRSGVDQRWLSIGITDVEKGLMGIGRACLEAPMQQLAEMIEQLED